MRLVNAKEMMQAASRGHYAVGHFNLNNMESIRAYLLAAQEMKAPVILGVSGGTAKYMGGYKTITDTVEGFMELLDITVPVALHVDHGTYDQALAALEGGFSSIMFDGSSYPIAENIEKAKHLVELCRRKGISLEAEVGAIGGEEDGTISEGECADPAECKRIADLGVDMLAAGIGNIHGKYPANWGGLHFDVLQKIREVTGLMPLVLHGGSGIPEDQVKKAISMGVCKVNVNTECQIAFSDALAAYYKAGKDQESKGFVTRTIMMPGLEAAKAKCEEKIRLFGSDNKA